AVFDKSRAAGSEIKLYIDGAPQTATSVNNSTDNTNNFGNNPFFIASRAGTTLYDADQIDDVRIYSRGLSGAEASALYKGISGGVEGEMIYNGTSHIPQFCDGSAWRPTK